MTDREKRFEELREAMRKAETDGLGTREQMLATVKAEWADRLIKFGDYDDLLSQAKLEAGKRYASEEKNFKKNNRKRIDEMRVIVLAEAELKCAVAKQERAYHYVMKKFGDQSFDRIIEEMKDTAILLGD